MSYSTIIKKKKKCVSCGRMDYWFSNKMCKSCATVSSTNKRIAEYEEDVEGESRSNLIEDLDAIVSLCIRHSSANKEGIISCFTCDKQITIAEAQCSHFIPRAHMATRWEPNNLEAACKECNEYKGGNLEEYEKRIGSERAEALRELSRDISKPTIDELKQLLASFRFKFHLVKKKV